MKKTWMNLLALLLALALVLAGCGSTPEDVTGKVEPNSSQTEPQTPNTEPQTPSTEAETQSTEPENLLALGQMEGGTYTNTYAGFGCKLDESWVFTGADQLQEFPEQVEGTLEGTDLEGFIDSSGQIMDMQAQNPETMQVVNVLLQKVNLQERLAYMAMSEDKMINTVIETGKDTMTAAYAEMGITVTGMKRVTIRFMGRPHAALYTLGDLQGVPMHMVQLFDYTRGAYLVTTTFTCYGENQLQSMLDLFFAISE